MALVERPNWLQDLIQRFEDSSIDEITWSMDHIIEIRGEIKSIASSLKNTSPEVTHELQDFVFTQGLRLDPLSPFAGGVLQDASFVLRWSAVLPPASARGPVLVLRRHRFNDLSLGNFGVDEDSPLLSHTAAGGSLLICGATGSGKSSLLSALLAFTATDRRVVVLEDLEELPAISPLWLHLVAQSSNTAGKGEITLDMLFRYALRLTPELIVMGELRSRDSMVFFEALMAGHPVWSTFHAANYSDVKQRVERLGEGNLRLPKLGLVFMATEGSPRVVDWRLGF